jgi:hypothetical protein
MSPHQQFGHETAFYVQLIRQSHTTDFVSLKKNGGELFNGWMPQSYVDTSALYVV